MRAAKDIAAFVQEPAGHYLCGPRWLVFAAEAISGMIVWESPTPDDSAQVVRTLPASLSRGPHGYFIDARRLAQTIDPQSFSLVLGTAGPTLPQYESVEKCAVVLPAGMGAAVLRGFFSMIDAPFEVQFFADAVAALEWAGQPDAKKFLEQLDDLQRRASGTPPMLFQLRALLDRDPTGATVESAAKALSLSTRSLQRRLIEAGTSFRAELSAARLRKAQRLLTGTDLKITAVALEVGCASSQHLSAMFRKMTGESPSGWRATHRAN